MAMLCLNGHVAGFMVRENALSTVWAPAPQLSVARTVKFDVPVPVGVPETRPEGFMFIPEGSEPPIRPKVTAPCPPVVLNWYEYA